MILTQTRYSNTGDIGSCSQYVIATNPGAFAVDPSAEANARSICRYFRSSIGGQLLTWASILGMATVALVALRRNPDIDQVRMEMHCLSRCDFQLNPTSPNNGKQRREAEQEARWARQRGLLPANPTFDDDSDSGNSSDGGSGGGGGKPGGGGKGRSGNGNATATPSAYFRQRLYFSSAPTAPSLPTTTTGSISGTGDGDLRHPLLQKDHLSSVREGEEEEREWGEAKDAMAEASTRV
jgi:hypothetical protein